MEGFFKDDDIKDSNANCMKCKLFRGCASPKMKPTGKGRKKILVVAEAPGAKEDERGEQLIGQAGQVLRKVLEENGIDLDKDCWKTNAVCCRPKKNKTPSKTQIKCCHPKLERFLKKKKPHLIILLGGAAVESFINTRLAEASGGINRWRGFIIPDQRYKAWVVPTFHPSFLLRNHNDTIITNLFKRDLKRGLKKLNKKVPVPGNYKIEVIPNAKAEKIKTDVKLLAFDYETTGKKPYKKGHKIVCCALSIKKGEAMVFEMTKKMKKLWIPILKDKRIKKTAHNLKFEHLWGRKILKTVTKGWVHDTMVGAHIQDNRKKITGLKFQGYVHFGQEDYSSHLDKFIKNNKEEYNKIEEAPIEEVMKYCAIDTILQFKLAVKQMKEIGK